MKKNAIAFLLFSASYCSAQRLIPFYDSVNKFHISYPESWSTAYRLIESSGLSSFKDEIGEHKKKSFERVEVVKDNQMSMALLLELGLVNTYYSNSKSRPNRSNLKYIVNSYEHLMANGKDTINLVDIKVYICHNTDIFILFSTCLAKDFDRYRKLYVEIANSVYFD